jgi:hypothetical protein
MVEGIVNVVTGASQPMYLSFRQWLTNAEDAYDWFTTRCAAAGPEGCALAEPGDGAPDVRQKLEGLFDRLYQTPMSVANTKGWGIVTSGLAKSRFPLPNLLICR